MRKVEEEREIVHEENKNRDRSSDSHKEAVSVFLSALRTHQKTLQESPKIAESQSLISGTVEQSQISFYRI